MRILFAGECPFTPNSLGKVTFWATLGLARRGHEVYNMCPASMATLWEHGLRWRPRPSRDPTVSQYSEIEGLGDYEFLVYPWSHGLERLYRQLKPDAILLYGTPYGPPLHEALVECREKELPCTGYFLNESWKLIPDYSLHSANVTAFTVPARWVKETYVESLEEAGIPRDLLEERITVTPHGLPESVYTSSGVRLIEDDRVIIGSFAKNHARKDLGALIRAYALLARWNPKAWERTVLFLPAVDFAGDGSWNLDLAIHYAKMETGVDVSESVFTLDPVQASMGLTEWEVASIYRSMDLFVFPSRGEAFGLPPLEAGLTRTPILLSDIPVFQELWDGLPDYCFFHAIPVVESSFGLYYPDPYDLARRLETLVLHEDMAVECGERAWRIARGYTVERMVEGLEDIIKATLNIGFDPLNKYLEGRSNA